MGVDVFIHDMTALGFEATLEAELVVYRVVPVDGAHAGRPIETGVAVTELQSLASGASSLASLPGGGRVLTHQHRRVPEARLVESQPSDIGLGRCSRRRCLGEPCPGGPERGGRVMHRASVAMTAANEDALVRRLVRDDGQEDICLATYRPSTGLTRRTALIRAVVPPEPGDRHVHGNATVTADYILRGAEIAQQDGSGLVLLHSHPGATRWQPMSPPDRDCEASYANLARELTGLPLVGMTLATGDHTWSARHWDLGVGRAVDSTHCTNVRVIGDVLALSWNDAVQPPPESTGSQTRTVNAWGEERQSDLVRRRVLVVGAGSVGLDVLVRLAASGLCHLTVMDFDLVELHNLDRLIGAAHRDVHLRRPKIHVARREATAAATSQAPRIDVSDLSVCEPRGLELALDHDLVFSCVDRSWPRAVLNSMAYS